MEEKQKNEKQAKKMVLLLGILTILLIATVVYTMNFRKELAKSQATVDTQNSSQAEENKTEVNKVEEAKKDETKKEEKTMTASDRYALYIKGLEKSINKLKDSVVDIEGEKYYSAITFNKDGYSDTGIFDLKIEYNTAYFEFSDDSKYAKKYGEKYNIDAKIVKGGLVSVGNGGSSELLWYITNEGKLYTAYSSMNEEILTFNENKKLKNIVDIIQFSEFDAATAIAVDIDGNIFEI